MQKKQKPQFTHQILQRHFLIFLISILFVKLKQQKNVSEDFPWCDEQWFRIQLLTFAWR